MKIGILKECHVTDMIHVVTYSAFVKYIKYVKQDRQCTYKITMRCVHATIVAWKSNKYYIF